VFFLHCRYHRRCCIFRRHRSMIKQSPHSTLKIVMSTRIISNIRYQGLATVLFSDVARDQSVLLRFLLDDYAPIGPTSFQFDVPSDAPISISPLVGTVQPGTVSQTSDSTCSASIFTFLEAKDHRPPGAKIGPSTDSS
jgi:hypothetical protein